MTESEPLDCRSEEGEAVALVDALIVIMRQVAKCDFALPQVREALKDLYDDPATARVLGPMYDKIHRGEIAAGRNRMPGNRQSDRLWTGGPFRFRDEPDVADHSISTIRRPR